jgi:D-threo-aldose 1-dehydrogenase
MNPIELRSLGRCGVELPQLGFGCASIGGLFRYVSEEATQATLQAAWAAGIRYFDTSPWYGLGRSEEQLGLFLASRPRDEFVVSTKVGRYLTPPDDPEHFDRGGWVGGNKLQHHFDYTYDGIMRSYEDSLKRLRLGRVDRLLIHDLDMKHFQTSEGVMARMKQLTDSGWKALSALKLSGVIRGIGAGVNEMGVIPRVLDAVPVDFFLVAMPYTILDQKVLDSEFPRCAQNNVGIVLGAVFSSGITATGTVKNAKYNYQESPPEIIEKVNKIEAVCAEYRVPLAALALQFPLAHPLVASVIPGAFQPEQVTKNIENFTRPIPPALWSGLKSRGLLRQDAPVPR